MGIIGNIIHASIRGIGNKSTVTINGQTYVGRNVVVNGNTVFVDGKDVGIRDRKVVIQITGDVGDIEAGSGTVEVTGKSGAIHSGSGSVTVHGNVGGDVKAGSGSIKIGQRVDGSVKSGSGNIDIGGGVMGNVSTLSGDIRHG